MVLRRDGGGPLQEGSATGSAELIHRRHSKISEGRKGTEGSDTPPTKVSRSLGGACR